MPSYMYNSSNSDTYSNSDSELETVTIYSDNDDNYSNGEYYNGLNYENNNKNRIVLCEIFNMLIHGYDDVRSDPNVIGHYLSIDSFNLDEFYEDENGETEINIVAYLHNAKYQELLYSISNHLFIKNYLNIIRNPSYIKPEIGLCLQLTGGETVVILKTFWLRLIQRTWKKIYKNKQIINQRRSIVSNILYRSQNGKWPYDCNRLPTLNGMLSYLKK